MHGCKANPKGAAGHVEFASIRSFSGKPFFWKNPRKRTEPLEDAEERIEEKAGKTSGTRASRAQGSPRAPRRGAEKSGSSDEADGGRRLEMVGVENDGL